MGSKPTLSVVVFCQSCGTKLMFAPNVVGKKARCLTCGHIFTVPAIKGQKTAAPTQRQSKQHSPASSTAAPKSYTDTTESTSQVDSLAELAASEKTAAGEKTALGQFVGEGDDVENVIAGPATDPEATATALSVMQALFYIAVMAVVVFLLVRYLGPFLAAWILLPIVVVFGRKIVFRIVFLLTGGALGTPKAPKCSQ